MIETGSNGRAVDSVHVLARLRGLIRTKYATVLAILLLGVLGFWLAPADTPTGEYSTKITVMLDGQVLSTDYRFRLDQIDSQPVTLRTSQGPYQLIVAGQEAFRYAFGAHIAYRLQILDAGGWPLHPALDAVSSTLAGPGFRQVLPPTERDAEWLVFKMRVLYKAKIVTALLFMVAGLWLTELVPLAAGAMLIPVIAVVAGVTDPETVLQPFAHPIIVLFLSGFLMAEGMRRTGVDRWIALTVLHYASPRPALLMLTMMALTAFLSMWMSNTASVAIVIPIALAVADRLSATVKQDGFRRALILGVAYAGTVGGIGSAIGTPANILALTFLNEYTRAALTFADWFWYGLPMVILMVPTIWLYLLVVFKVDFRHTGAAGQHDILEEDGQDRGRLRPDQRAILLVFVAVVALWLTERWHQVPTGIVALGGALSLFLIGIIKQEDLHAINWNALLTFGGGLAIGMLLVTTGVSDWIALQLIGLAALPPLLVVFLVAGLTLVASAFISNTAAAAMLIPLAIPLAQILRLDPRLLVLVAAIGSSIDFALVIGTPPTMMAYSTGLFKASDIFKRGVILDLIGLVLLSLGVVWIWRLFGVVTF